MVYHKKRYAPALKFKWLTPIYAQLVPIFSQYRRYQNQLIKQAQLQSNQKVLDVGCGSGELLRMLKAAYPNVEATGLDIDSDILKIAQNKSEKESHSIRYVQGSSDNLPFPATSFDQVFSGLLFHHLPMIEKQKTLLEIHRVLKEGGQAHILDFGRPNNLSIKIGFLALQLFDGIENVRPHGEGRFVDLLLASPFTHIRLTNRFQTPIGTLYTYLLIK